MLDGLADEYREERYRAAPALRRLVLGGQLGHQTGEGFYDLRGGRMRAVTFQDVREVRVEERPDPELKSRDEAIVAIRPAGSAARTCTSTTGA